MPINPFTGEIEGYDSPSTSAGVGMAAMSATGMESPLAFRMLEQSPGFLAAAGFGINRGANTLIKGGYGQRRSGANKFFSTTRSSKDFFGSRGSRVGTNKTPFLRPSMRNHNFLRPRNFFQFSDLSPFADSKYNRYTPYGSSAFLGNSKIGEKIINKLGIELKEGETPFGPGVFAGITAATRIDRLEKKALAGSSRAQAKLAQVDKNIIQLAQMNNPELLKFGAMGDVIHGSTASGVTPHVAKASRPSHARKASNRGLKGKEKRQRGFIKQTDGIRTPITNPYMSAMERAVPSGSVNMFARTTEADDLAKGVFRNAMPGYVRPDVRLGIRGDLMASSMPGVFGKYFGGYVRGARGFGMDDIINGRALDGAEAARKQFGESFVKAFGDDGLKLASGQIIKTSDEAIGFLRSTGGGKFFSEIGAKGIAKIATSGGGKMLAARAGAMAIPGLNLIAAASFAYDIGQMAGEVVKSGIELASDAGKSLQGTIAKPMFGMGYRDTEAAATSRSRGVMAIQNSRLNMRSLLGSEAAMMAAHYG